MSLHAKSIMLYNLRSETIIHFKLLVLDRTVTRMKDLGFELLV